jgi:hypothetical protein
MFLVLWEFEVKPGCEQRFERVYGPGGDWDSLFRRDPHHERTELFRDTVKPRVYLTADFWKSRKIVRKISSGSERRIQITGRRRGGIDRERTAHRVVRNRGAIIRRAPRVKPGRPLRDRAEETFSARSRHAIPLRQQDTRCALHLPSWRASQ